LNLIDLTHYVFERPYANQSRPSEQHYSMSLIQLSYLDNRIDEDPVTYGQLD